jgi:hypothetical protein
MLGTPRSPLIRPCDRIAARAARRDLAVANRGGRLKRTTRCIGSGREDETGGAMLGGVIGMTVGGGSAGTLAALPMPEGSLTEPLSPRALPGPGGMPLTPASCAGAAAGAARTETTASAASHRREKTGCMCFMAR